MPSRQAPPREVRIVGGQWKRTRLPVFDKPGLRPTPDRVRETLFNWLGHDLTGWSCVDAFAGTGALGFEAASRGASQVLLVEQDPALVANLRAIQKRLSANSVQVQRANGLSVLAALAADSVDLILLDPPFEANLFDKALASAARAAKADGFVYLEAPAVWSDAQLEQFHLLVWRHMRAGAVHAHLLRRRESGQPASGDAAKA